MTKEEIFAAIGQRVGSQSLYIWYVGVTHDPAKALAYWRDVQPHFTEHWVNYEARSLADAQEVAAHFTRLKMRDGTKELLTPLRTAYVFVF